MSFNLAYKKTGKTDLKKWKERKCNCVSMVDIGEYNSCRHYCKYCYANFSEDEVKTNYQNHYDDSTMLIGRLNDNDIIKKVGK